MRKVTNILLYLTVMISFEDNTGAAIRLLGSGPGDVMRCGFNVQRQAGTQINFVTSEYAMLYIVRGKAIYRDADHHEVPLCTGDVWQRFPDVPHTIHCLEACGWYHVAVPAPVLQLLKVLHVPTLRTIAFHIGRPRLVIRRFEQVRKRLESGSRSQLDICLLAMQQLMIDLHRLARETSEDGSTWLDTAQLLLRENLNQRIKVDSIARHLNMSYTSFRTRFVTATGCSPGQYRIRHRIESAQEQLAGSSRPIAQIADHLGYPDVYSFSAQFSLYTGTSPGQYRRQWQWDTGD